MSDVSSKIKGLYAIIDNTFSPEKTHLELAQMLLVGGCRVLQLRVKKDNASLWDQEVFEVAMTIMNLKERYDFTFIINDYVDVAAELKADGVHVGKNDMSVSDIKKRTGSNLIVGRSSYSIEEALAVKEAGADYVAFGAIYPTQAKGPEHPIQGADKLREYVSKVASPIVAIGGINRTNIDEVWSTGVSSIAMISALTQVEDVVSETKWYVNKLK
jgi:thiamine-phosphate pyrophosphorylase